MNLFHSVSKPHLKLQSHLAFRKIRLSVYLEPRCTIEFSCPEVPIIKGSPQKRMHIGIHRGAQQQGNLVLLTQFPADFY